jgi:predicted unusual protein kinase regulating ubiquinone biosynthesis (AarF/ABC1/UbiB family)
LRRAGLEGRVELAKADMTEFMPPRGERIDVVSCLFALHHLPSREHVRRCLSRIAMLREEQGAGVWLFDVARPRHPETPREFSEIAAQDATLPHRDDLRHSLAAAWSFAELSSLTDETHMGPFQHEEAQLLMRLYQTHALPPKGLLRPLTRPTRVDLRVAEIHAQTSLRTLPASRSARVLSVLSMLLRILLTLVMCGARRLASIVWEQGRNAPSVKERVANVVARRLGRLKGPLMKLGQLASQSSASADVRKALKSLQDESAPIDSAVVRRAVEKELGRPLNEVFTEWSPTPFASGVVSQMHYAVLKDGSQVAVKVQYPGLPEIVKTDLRLLRRLLPLIKFLLRLTNAEDLFTEVHSLMTRECDFEREARIQSAFRRAFAGDDDVIIPRVYPELSTARVITMEYVNGKRFKDFLVEASQEEKNRAGKIIWRFAATSLNGLCTFNADPHPGNFLFVDGKVCFLDFGFSKRWSVDFIERSKRQALALLANDLDGFADVICELGFVEDENRFDFAAALAVLRRTTVRPWVEDSPFLFTEHFARRELNELITTGSQGGAMRVPEDYLAYSRLFWGLYTLLAHLQVEANWHRIILPTLRSAAEPLVPIDRPCKPSAFTAPLPPPASERF